MAVVTLKQVYETVLTNMAVFLFMGGFAVFTLQPEPLEAAAMVCALADAAAFGALALEGRLAKRGSS
jgi:hypothetical protein